jgi:hypothetical protein
MAAPPFVPVAPLDRPRAYESPAVVPAPWAADRPAAITGRQPVGPRLGVPGPDQGYGLLLAGRVKDRVRVQAGEHVEDALSGCLAIALRRASLFGRAPVIHDFTLALTIWGLLDAAPPADLVAERRRAFEGLAHTAHHYDEIRALVDRVPESTLRLTPDAAAKVYPAEWKALVGA